MAATPRNGSMIFLGKSGATYSIDVYISDVANAAVTWEPTGAAGTGSLTFWRTEEPVVLIDFSVATGLADTTNISLTQNGGLVSGSVIRYANFLNTINTRPKLAIAFPAGVNIGAKQAA